VSFIGNPWHRGALLDAVDNHDQACESDDKSNNRHQWAEDPAGALKPAGGRQRSEYGRETPNASANYRDHGHPKFSADPAVT
jgi:hypothetical protein